MSRSPRKKLRPTPSPPHPVGHLLAEFEPLLPAEAKLREACRKGEMAKIGDERPDAMTEANRIRAEVLRVFCLGLDPAAPVHEHGVWAQGAWITGHLDLSDCSVPRPLLLEKSVVAGALILADATTVGVSFDGTRCRGITGDRLTCRSGVFLRAGFVAEGTVRFAGAAIAGDLACRKGKFVPTEEDALDLDGAKIAGNVFLNGGFVSEGTVRLLGAIIGGNLECRNGRFEPTEGAALNCDGAKIAGGVFLDKGFVAEGSVRLLGAIIGGDLVCNNGRFEPTEGGALNCDRAKIDGGVFLRDGFVAKRTVRLSGASIGGDLTCRGGRFEGDVSLHLQRAEVSGSLFLDDGFHATGVVDLSDLEVASIIDDAAAWTSGIWRLDGFVYRRFAGDAPADAATRLRWLGCQPLDHLTRDFRPQPWEQCAKVLAEMGHEADAVALRIEKRVRMRPLPLHRARTGADKTSFIAGLRAVASAPNRENLKVLRGAFVAYLRALGRQGRVRLGVFYDFVLCLTVGYGFRPSRAVAGLILVWLAAAMVYGHAVPRGVMAPTDALVYHSKTIPAECRLDWVDFEPQLGGDHDEARIAAARTTGTPPAVDANGVALVADWTTICKRAMPSEYTTYSPWLYALDVLLPIVDLRQENDWAPRVTDETGAVIAPWSQSAPWGWGVAVRFLEWIPGFEASKWGWGYAVRLFEWLLILVGWGLSALLVGAVTGIIRRD